MSRGLRRVLSVVLSLIMTVQLLPVTSYAEDTDEIEIIEGEEDANKNETWAKDGETHLAEGETGNPYGEGWEESKSYLAEDVLFEHVDMREEAVKHFRLSDGTDVAITYAFPVHFLGNDGRYYEVDNTLELPELW